MRNDDYRRVPLERRMTVAVQVHDVGIGLARDLQQPLARGIDIAPRPVHPFELQLAFAESDVAQRGDLPPLLARKAAAHRRDGELYVRQRTREIERVIPNAAERVGCHENALSDHRSSTLS